MTAQRTPSDRVSAWPWPISSLHRSRGRPAPGGTVASPPHDQVPPLRD